MSSPGGALADIVDDPWLTWLLESARERLGTDVAYLADFTDQDQRIRRVVGSSEALGIAAGTTVPLEGTFCVRVLGGVLPAVVTAAGRNPVTRELPATAALGVGSYVGAPIRGTDGRALGMLCCLGTSDGAGLDGESARFVEFLADLIGQRLGSLPSNRPAVLPDDDGAAPRPRPVFQPIVELASRRPVGYEALSRFEGEDTAAVFAREALAGRGTSLERAALVAVLDAIDGTTIDVPVFLNLSPAALCEPAVLDLLLAPREQVVGIEITEHSPVPDYPALLRIRDRLRAAGMPVSVDDAGAGYASLQHVLQLRPDVVKLDACLVAGVHHDPARAALISAMAAFTRDIGASAIAEGVEEEAECEALVARGIELGQGWLCGRPGPLPAEPREAAVSGARSRSGPFRA